MHQQDAYRMIQRRAKAAGIEKRIGNHTFRATGITAYLKNNGKLDGAAHRQPITEIVLAPSPSRSRRADAARSRRPRKDDRIVLSASSDNIARHNART
jgi:integrase